MANIMALMFHAADLINIVNNNTDLHNKLISINKNCLIFS